MKLRELVNKIDNDIVLWIVREPDTNVLFKRENVSDVIPEDLLCMEVGTVFNEFNSLYIYVQRNSRKGSFRELLNCLHGYEYIDVYVANRDGTRKKVCSKRTVFCIDNKYNHYPVKRISPYRSEWGDRIEIEIEPCEEMKEGKEMKADGRRAK